jgi:hypothetical protein
MQKLPRPEYWLLKGGFVIMPSLYFNHVTAAILKFQREVTDPKAMVLPTFNTVHDVVRVLFSIPTRASLL